MSERFGLLYESTFTGSMVGTSPTVFAVWGYVVACGFGGRVTLNPRLLAPILGTTIGDVEAAIRVHCQPDPDSRSAADEGRRLRHLGGFAYEVVNHDVYKSARALEEKRASDRARKRSSREQQARTVDVPILSAPGCDLSQKSVTEADSLFSSSSDLISSDREGVQREGDHAPPEPELHTRLGDWQCPPELYAEAERDYRIERETLDYRIGKLRPKRIGKRDGVVDRTEYVRGLLPDWATWGPAPKRASTSPPASKPVRPPWVSPSDVEFARQIGRSLVDLASDYARASPTAPELQPHEDARAGFVAYLERRARAPAAA